MGSKTKIEWTVGDDGMSGSTWNPIRGCTRVSEGCRFCYAERVAARFSGEGQAYEGLAVMTKSGPRWTHRLTFVEEHLGDPLRWKRPRRVFTNSMSDLFHESVPDEWLYRILAVMAAAERHTFQTLTKRAERMRDFLTTLDREDLAWRVNQHLGRGHYGERQPWPLKNCWWGVSVENQETADARIPLLLQTPAAIRFISYEPALGPVDLRRWLGEACCRPPWEDDTLHAADCRGEFGELSPGIGWCIAGGESGPGARTCDTNWLRSIVGQCRAAGCAAFVKQLGARPFCSPTERSITGYFLALKDKKGGSMEEWPEDLKIREYPQVGEEE